jgi:F0F1-type ATP synthase assembly protein I
MITQSKRLGAGGAVRREWAEVFRLISLLITGFVGQIVGWLIGWLIDWHF